MTFWWAQEWKQPSRLPIFGCCSKSWTLFDRGRTLAPKSEENLKIGNHTLIQKWWMKQTRLPCLTLLDINLAAKASKDRNYRVWQTPKCHDTQLPTSAASLGNWVVRDISTGERWKVLKIRGDSELQLKLRVWSHLIWSKTSSLGMFEKLRVAVRFLIFFAETFPKCSLGLEYVPTFTTSICV